MKKILVIGIAAILTLGIAGCTKSSNPSENTGGNSTTPSKSVKPSDSTTPSSGSSNSSTNSSSSSSSTTPVERTYTITFRQEGQSDVVYTVIENESLTETIQNPVPKNGYEVTWDYEAGDIQNVTENKVINIKKTPIQYTINYDLQDGLETIANPKEYTIESDITLNDPSKEGYTFTGWTGSNGETPEKEITISGKYENLSYTANWSANKYSINYNVNGGSELEDKTQTVTYGESYTLEVPTRIGYTFVGWGTNTNGGLLTNASGSSKNNWTIASDTTLYANWNANPYQLTLNNGNTSGGSITTSSGTRYCDSSVTVEATTNAGYTFTGWYEGSTKVYDSETYTFNMPTSDRTLTAKWTANKYSINYNVNGGANHEDNPSTYTIEDDAITLLSPTIEAYSVKDGTCYSSTFTGWFTEETFKNKIEQITKGTTGDLDLYAQYAKTEISLSSYLEKGGTIVNYLRNGGKYVRVNDSDKYDENGKYIYFGFYPQTYVSDTTITTTLDGMSESSTTGYITYNGEEYKKVKATPYQSGYKFSNNTITIESGSTYYFKVEPIKWRILENSDGTYKLMSEYVLTNSFYYTYTSKRTIDGQTIYPNNYEYSTIRDFINNEFYNEAFALDDSLIQTTLVDNSASTANSSSDSYTCNNTNDKVYLLSYKDLKNTSYGFNSYTARRGQTTDYARATGTWMNTDSIYYGNTFWWSRSPIYDDSYNAYGVNYLGDLYNYYVYSSDYGVRPALTIKIA